ncbi:MAG TPA: M64 family metallopeptidase [Rhodanobacteraceae bacterium]|nr:M64 family metallopeptidase [Rhodanobacteraceae bacterium]
MRSTRALCALLVLCVSAAYGADGLVLSFDAGTDVRLAAPPSFVARVAEPRSFEGPAWTATATGATSWTRTFPAPRAFDADPAREIPFSIAVPRVAAGDRITIRDEQGHVRWRRAIDAQTLSSAAKRGADIGHRVTKASAATRRLSASTPSPGLVRPLGEHTRRPLPAHLPTHALAAPKATETTWSVTGSVVDAGPIIVRAFDAASGRFVQSTEQDWYTQTFDLPLPAGNYVFEVDDNLEYIDSDFFYRKPTRTAPIRISASTRLADIHRDAAAGEFSLLAHVPCSLLAEPSYLQAFFDVWATSADGAHIVRQARVDEATTPSGTGSLCDVRYVAQLSPGHYAIEASPLGWEPRRFDDVEIVDGARSEKAGTFEAIDRTQVWRGTVVDAANRPAAGAFVYMYDELQNETVFPQPVSDTGAFEIPYRRQWIAEFRSPSSGSSDIWTRHLQVLDGDALPSTVVIDDLALEAALDNGLVRIYGNGDRANRYNILFLADGYTDVAESFTDVDGNGQWDGFVWYDLDGDGAYSGSDLLGYYGSDYLPPDIGDDPTAGNEPFDDVNGDGVLSVDDPDLFLIDARTFLRALLGSDFWDAHRDAFNAYALFEPSRQAGYGVVSSSGQTLLTRDTLYGSTLDQDRNLVTVDRPKAMQHALAVLPDVDLVVVLVNQTVVTGARGNTTVSQPGSMVYPTGAAFGLDPATTTPAHEMGHFVASLCDEYSEFTGVAPGGSTSFPCPNASHSPTPAGIPWAQWLEPGFAMPTRNLDVALGVYEGADYYPGGAYRPSYASIMRDLSPLFNAPSRAALEHAVRQRTGVTLRGHSSHARP